MSFFQNFKAKRAAKKAKKLFESLRPTEAGALALLSLRGRRYCSETRDPRWEKRVASNARASVGETQREPAAEEAAAASD
jgi:hypothetical protein